MRNACNILLLFALLAGASSRVNAADTAVAAAQDPYTRAVHEYVAAASREVAAVETEVKSLEKSSPKRDLSQVKAAAEECRGLIAQLKEAGPSNFDRIKAQYEKARATLTAEMARARQG